jgi:hypothetical protein
MDEPLGPTKAALGLRHGIIIDQGLDLFLQSVQSTRLA